VIGRRQSREYLIHVCGSYGERRSPK